MHYFLSRNSCYYYQKPQSVHISWQETLLLVFFFNPINHSFLIFKFSAAFWLLVSGNGLSDSLCLSAVALMDNSCPVFDAGPIGLNVSVCICMDVAMHEIGDSIEGGAERRRGGVGSERGKMDGVELQDECR